MGRLFHGKLNMSEVVRCRYANSEDSGFIKLFFRIQLFRQHFFGGFSEIDKTGSECSKKYPFNRINAGNSCNIGVNTK